jgi:hypothetical protein
MLKLYTTLVATILLIGSAVAEDFDYEWICDWSADGKRWTISVNNHGRLSHDCTAKCTFKTKDSNITYPKSCGGSVLPGEHELCSGGVPGSPIVDSTDGDADCN